jgi:hypothetical protein
MRASMISGTLLHTEGSGPVMRSGIRGHLIPSTSPHAQKDVRPAIISMEFETGRLFVLS